MRLGGVIFFGLGILIVVLVTNGRWDNVWAAMLGNAGGTGGGFSATPVNAGTPVNGGIYDIAPQQGGGFSVPGGAALNYPSGNATPTNGAYA
jgi:hypothetical protein